MPRDMVLVPGPGAYNQDSKVLNLTHPNFRYIIIMHFTKSYISEELVPQKETMYIII